MVARQATVALVMGFSVFAGRFDALAQSSEPATIDVPACASDPAKLGLSRIVEIDPANGPHFGGGHGAETDFLRDHEVVLTFDDGPMRAFTRPILKALAEHCTRATFFMVGRMASADPSLARDIAAAGHTVGTHTLTHLNLQATGVLKGRQEVDGGIAAVTRALGRIPAPFFRFPFLGGNRHVDGYTRAHGMATFWVDVDAKDYQTRNPKIVHDRIMAQLRERRKGIILMHDIQPSTARAIADLLDDLRDKGFKVVHVVPKPQDGAVATARTVASPQIAKAVDPSQQSIGQPTVTKHAMEPSMAKATPEGAGTAAPPSSPKAVEAPTGDSGEVLPWLKAESSGAETASAPSPAPTPAQKPKRAARTVDGNASWFPKIFSY